MRSLHNKIFYISVLIVAVMLISGLYYTKLVFSDSQYIKNNSIEYLLLVPSILKEIPLEPTDYVKTYYYSSADGNKPVINSVEFTTLNTPDEVYKKITNYFNNLGFENYDNSYKKENMELSITHSKGESDTTLVNVAIFEYL